MQVIMWQGRMILTLKAMRYSGIGKSHNYDGIGYKKCRRCCLLMPETKLNEKGRCFSTNDEEVAGRCKQRALENMLTSSV